MIAAERADITGVVTTSFPAFDGDHRGIFVAAQVRSLARKGRAIEVLTGTPSAGGDWSPGAQISVTRLPSFLFAGAGAPEILETADRAERFRAYREAVSFQVQLAALVRDRASAWTSVESHWLVPSALAVAFAAPVLDHTAYCHSGDVALLQRLPGGAALVRWLARRCARIVCVSPELRERLLALTGQDAVVAARTSVGELPVAPGFAARSVRRSRALGSGIVAAGRLVPVKGFDVLIHAVGRIPARVRPSLLIAGDGPERDRLHRLAHACRVRLHLPGTISQQRLARLLADAAVCVVPSRILPSGRSEGMPLIAREALDVGVRVVASAVGGLPTLAAHNPDRLTLVPPQDPSSLAAVLAQICAQTPPLRKPGGA